MKLLALALIPAAVLAGGALELTQDTFADAFSGKNALVKFHAPWYDRHSCCRPSPLRLACTHYFLVRLFPLIFE
jgi:hypothetical protein